MTSTTAPVDRRTALVALMLCTAGLVFDGYDLVVYGALVPMFLRSPDELGPIDADTAGFLGSAALVGVLIGALVGGAAADRWGRRPVLLAGYGGLSLGMAVTALTSTVVTFGAARVATGLGIGVVVAVTGALVAEVAPDGRRQLWTTVAYCGIPVGSVVGTVIALVALDAIGWRGLFWIGVLPAVTILPAAWRLLPESPAFVARSARGDERPPSLFARPTVLPALVLGVVSAVGLLLIFALGTWLPELLRRSGFDADAALVSLAALNGGAIVGALTAAPLAERFGPRRVVAVSFAVGAVGLLLLALVPEGAVLLAVVAVVGVGTTGTQILVIGLATATFPVSVRAAGVAWCTGFGRVGGIVGPTVVGALVAADLGVGAPFAVLAVLALAGGLLTLAVRPASRPS